MENDLQARQGIGVGNAMEGQRNTFIFIGQFGNKVGLKLIGSLDLSSSLMAQKGSNENDIFISIDTELKVIKTLTKISKLSSNVDRGVFDKCGRGGNWSMGYTLQREDEFGMAIKDIVVKAVRKQTERNSSSSPTNYSNGIIIIHSLVGGTGGGLGCSVLESLRDEFPKIHITSITTAPFVSGEGPLQHYNALLTLHWLQRYADCVLLFHNDEVMNSLTKTMEQPKAGKRGINVTLDEINDYICYSTATLFFKTPLYLHRKEFGDTPKRRKGRETDTHHNPMVEVRNISKRTLNERDLRKKLANMNISGELDKRKPRVNSLKNDAKNNGIENKSTEMPRYSNSALDDLEYGGSKRGIFDMLTSHPGMKFITSYQKYSKQCTSNFKPVLSSLIRDIPKQDQNGQLYQCSGLVLTSRGEYSKAFEFEKEKIMDSLTQTFMNESSLDSCAEIVTSPLCVPGYHFPLSLSLHLNTSRVADFIDHVIYKVSLQQQHSAYLHWYTKFGIMNEHFTEAAEALTSVVQEYREL